MTKLVAVYGTLKRGFGNHRVMQMDNGQYFASGRTKTAWTMYGGYGYPRVVEQVREDGVGVKVEVFECDSVDNMDRLEGHPRFFQRKPVVIQLEPPFPVEAGETGTVEAWMYFHPPLEEGQGQIEEDGEWKGGKGAF